MFNITSDQGNANQSHNGRQSFFLNVLAWKKILNLTIPNIGLDTIQRLSYTLPFRAKIGATIWKK